LLTYAFGSGSLSLIIESVLYSFTFPNGFSESSRRITDDPLKVNLGVMVFDSTILLELILPV